MRLLCPGAALLVTVLLVASGVDARFRDMILERNPPDEDHLRFVSFFIGMYLPVTAGLLALLLGLLSGSRELKGVGTALVQTVLLVGALTLVLKVTTGRPPPVFTDAHDFQFLGGLVSRGRRVMWPSGHTTSAVSVAAAVGGLYGVRRTVSIVAHILALAIAASMLWESFHWLSDVIAGALIAYPIGRETGATFRSWVLSIFQEVRSQ
jgi:membrane-associated phospholipid phosphatase